MPSGLTMNALVAVQRRSLVDTVPAGPQLGSANVRWYSQTYIFPPSAMGVTLAGVP